MDRTELAEVRDSLAMVAEVGLADPHIIVELRALCERVGYGNVMSSASALWRQRLGEQAGGEFVSGLCRSTVEADLARVNRILAEPRATGGEGVEQIADDIVRDVCELPGDDEIEADDMLVVSVDDLRLIVTRNIAAALAQLPADQETKS